MAIDARLRLIGQDKTKKAFQSATGSLDKLKSSAASLRGGLVGLGAVLGGAVVLGTIKSVTTAASEMEEELQKFNVVFKSVQTEAQGVGRELQKSFGLSRVEATKLLASTGDLLTGFGFTGKSALNLSDQVNRLAVDLTSFSNFAGGASGASEILTKALLGERDALVSLGIKISEEDIKQRALAKGVEITNGTIDRQAKALITLEIATEQSANAVGDFSRSQGSFANQSRIFKNRLTDLATVAGELLLPTFTRVLGVLNKVLSTVLNLIQAENLETESLKDLEAQESKLVEQIEKETNARNRLNKTRQLDKVRAEIAAKKEQAITETELQKAETERADAKKRQDEDAEARAIALSESKKARDAAEKEEARKKAEEEKKQADFERESKIQAVEDDLELDALVNEVNAETDKTNDELAQKEKQRQADIANSRIQAVNGFLSAAAVLASIDKKNAGIAKGVALAQATISGILAVQRALANPPGPPFSIPAAIAAGTLATANVAKIASTPAFQTPAGLSRTVPGPANEPVPVLAHGGEEIGRGAGTGITIQVQGNVFNSEETIEEIARGVAVIQDRSGSLGL